LPLRSDLVYVAAWQDICADICQDSLTNWHANCKGTTHLACMRNKLYMKWVRDLHHPMPHITKKADSYADKFLRW